MTNMNVMSAELKRVKATVKRRIKTLKKSLKAAHAQLEACRNWEREQHDADLLQANLYKIKAGQKEVSVDDWETGVKRTLPLHPPLKPHEEIAKLYKRVKKLKKGLPYAEQMVGKIEKDLKEKEVQLIALESGQEVANLPKPQLPPTKKEQEAPKPYREYHSKGGIPIWVGKSGAKNDALTFQHAHGNDLWLHVADYPGSHVVVHAQDCDDETLKDAMQLALHYSKAKMHGEGEISITKVKHVRRYGKEKGKVQISNEKRIWIKKDPARLNQISSSSSLKR